MADDPSSGIPNLSRRHHEVLAFLKNGLSVKEISARMGVSNHTVNDYVKQIYRRFHVKSRAELLAKFIPQHNHPIPPDAPRLTLAIQLPAHIESKAAATAIADLIDAMSRWQIADGGGTIEIDDMQPLLVVGELVPHE